MWQKALLTFVSLGGIISPLLASGLSEYTIDEAIKAYQSVRELRTSPLSGIDDDRKTYLEEELRAPIPTDLWEFYKKCYAWYLDESFEFFDITIATEYQLVKENNKFHEQSKAPQQDLAFCSDTRGGYYVLIPPQPNEHKTVVRYWDHDNPLTNNTVRYSDKPKDQWSSLALWLKEQLE